MTKLSLLGTASALALSFALAQGASATEPRLLVDDNQTNLLSDGNANDGSTINKSYTANTDNSVQASSDDDRTANNSFNKSYTANIDKSVQASSDDDTATNNSFNKTATNSFNKSHTANTDNSVSASSDDDNVATNSFNTSTNTSTNESRWTSIVVSKDERVSETELEAEASRGSLAAVNGDAADNSIGRQNSGKIAGDDLNTGTQTDISLGDVMVNLATANAHLDSASMSAALKAGVDTGGINSVNLNGMHGIAQVSNNTGVAAQANNIALNAIVK